MSITVIWQNSEYSEDGTKDTVIIARGTRCNTFKRELNYSKNTVEEPDIQ